MHHRRPPGNVLCCPCTMATLPVVALALALILMMVQALEPALVLVPVLMLLPVLVQALVLVTVMEMALAMALVMVPIQMTPRRSLCGTQRCRQGL